MGLRSERKVLLALNRECADERVLCCARNIALRVDAGIEVLLIPSDGRMPTALEAFLERLRQDDVSWRLIHGTGDPARETVRYANDHEAVLCVVIDALENWTDGIQGAGKGNDPWKKLECPLVVAAVCEPKA